MFLSAIIPTIGRESLDKAVWSILNQETSGFETELIVVNDSGRHLSECSWMAHERVKVIETARKGRSVARNAGAAVSRGEFLFFLDDDDWVLPGGFAALYELSDLSPDAVVLFGGAQFSHDDGRVLGVMNMGMAGNRTSEMLSYSAISIGSAAVSSLCFIKVGGFNSQFHAYEDVDLFRKLSIEGDFACSPVKIGAILRGTGWNSASEYDSSFENFRVSREAMLSSAGIFSRLKTSATTPYARGRNFRAYVASAAWNLKHGRGMTLVSRLLYAILCVAVSGTSVTRLGFWRALQDTQPPESDVKSMGLDKREIIR